MHKSKQMDTLHLPDEIVEEILSRLPVKSLVRFKCVSKSCRSLIRSDRFIKRHLQKSIGANRWQAIFSSNSKTPNLKRCSLLSYLDDPSVTPLQIDDPITDHLTLDTQIIGHSNGLLCIFIRPNSFFLWNPATRFSLQLPKPDGDYVVKCGFGWDGESDAYKVFAVLSKRNGNGNEVKRIGSIYNSKTNSWKALEREHGSLDLRYWIGESASGKIHWPVRKGYIETFDLESEVFGRIELPRAAINPGFLLDGGRRGRLGLVCDDYDNAVPVRTVWEMEMYGVEESWAVVASCLINRRVNESSTHMAWTMHNGKLTCSPRVNIVGCDYRRVYVESLVQPVFDNNDA